jgi:hypothetical protein
MWRDGKWGGMGNRAIWGWMGMGEDWRNIKEGCHD